MWQENLDYTYDIAQMRAEFDLDVIRRNLRVYLSIAEIKVGNDGS
jgi:hypothetical protein